MRRKDREVTQIDEKLAMLKKYKIMQVAMVEGAKPYIVSLNYGYTFENQKLTLFFHCAKAGRKIDILNANNNVCFTLSGEYELVTGDIACDYGYGFESIVGFGKALPVEENSEKIAALNCIMAQQTEGEQEFTYSENHLKATAVYKIEVEEFSAKKRPAK